MPTTTSQIVISQIQTDGFSLGVEPVPSPLLDGLLPALAAAESSSHARKRGGDTYALRNILQAVPGIHELALNPAIFDTVRAVLGASARPVKAILFDKTPATNWNLRWHQDCVISTRARKEVAGFTAWSERVGIPHVRPPVEILQQMLAARLHIDDCPAENGALQVIPGSHAHGSLSPEEVEEWKQAHAPVLCTAQRGEVLYMRPLILHSSRPAANPGHRRVLHIEYASCDLPGGLEWGQ